MKTKYIYFSDIIENKTDMTLELLSDNAFRLLGMNWKEKITIYEDYENLRLVFNYE